MNRFASTPARMTSLLCMLAMLLAWQSPAVAEVVVENYDTGQKKAEYTVKKGKRNGPYTEYYVGGQVKVKARYKNDKLDGEYTILHGDGKPKLRVKYRKGERHGKYVEIDAEGKLLASGEYSRGVLDGPYKTYSRGKSDPPHQFKKGQLVGFLGKKVHSRSLEDMTGDIQEIHEYRAPFESATPELNAALHRLNTYRYLSGVPHDVELDEEKVYYAHDEADILSDQKLEREDVEAAYPQNQAVKVADDVASPTLSSGIDAFMADTMEAHVESLILRRQVLNPMMKKVGIGHVNSYAAMSKDDSSRGKAPDWKVITHPAPGYTPVDYFSADRPWLFIFNHKKFKSILRDKSVQIRPIEENLRLGKSLKIEKRTEVLSNIENPEAPPHHVIFFYPQDVEVVAGKRYWVQITGFQRPNGDLSTLGFLVEFTDPIDLTKKPKKKRSSPKKR